MVLGSIQPLIEMSTRNPPGDKERPTRKTDNLTAICEPRRLTTLRASTACYQLRMIDEGGCGAAGGVRIGRGNLSTRRKPTPVPLCSQHNPTWPDPDSNTGHRNGSRQLIAWAMARPLVTVSSSVNIVTSYNTAFFTFSALKTLNFTLYMTRPLYLILLGSLNNGRDVLFVFTWIKSNSVESGPFCVFSFSWHDFNIVTMEIVTNKAKPFKRLAIYIFVWNRHCGFREMTL
jgi:hypothetical protein